MSVHRGEVLVLFNNAKQLWDDHINVEHLREMALHIWGEDSRAMMANFEPTDAILMKYQNNIANCERAIRGNRVLDLGCNNGLYSYAAMRHGASHVVGVEPRGMFVDGLNAFSRKHNFPMEFCREYDSALPELLKEHKIDTVLMMGMDTFMPWEERMYDLRRSDVKWIVLQMHSLPKSWMGIDKEISEKARARFGTPVGFSLHYESHNVDTRAVINPLHRDEADPQTGFQHISPNGEIDLKKSSSFRTLRSKDYISKFIEYAGFTVEKALEQNTPVNDPTSMAATHGLYEWFLLQNKKG